MNPHTSRSTKSSAVSPARCCWGQRIISLDIAREQKVWLVNGFMPSQVPAYQKFEMTVGDGALAFGEEKLAEWGLDEAAYDYLRLAETRGPGVFECEDPWSAGYQKIDYSRVDLPAP